MGQPNNRRSSAEIIADILRLLRLGNAGRIEISQVSQINSEQASRYISRLVEAGMLEYAAEEMGLPCYRITPRGLALLGAIETLREKLPEDGVLDILRKSKITEMNIGKVFITRQVSDNIRKNKEFEMFIIKSLERYRKGDWGEMSGNDKTVNDRSRDSGRLLFAAYEFRGLPEIWISTSPGREYTTIMFPDEYASLEPPELYSAVKSAAAGG